MSFFRFRLGVFNSFSRILYSRDGSKLVAVSGRLGRVLVLLLGTCFGDGNLGTAVAMRHMAFFLLVATKYFDAFAHLGSIRKAILKSSIAISYRFLFAYAAPRATNASTRLGSSCSAISYSLMASSCSPRLARITPSATLSLDHFFDYFNAYLKYYIIW